MTQIDTRIIKNFLSDEEILEIETIVACESKDLVTYGYQQPDNKLQAITYYFNMEHERWQRIREIMSPKIKQHFGSDLVADTGHVLNSTLPYGIHTDVMSNFDPDGPLDPAWTFLIPLENVDSHTITFNEQCYECKTVVEWASRYQVEPKNMITEDEYQKYFSHVSLDEISYLSIDCVFPWQDNRGTLFAADRRKFHVSDNYKKTGLQGKKAIIMWTNFLKSTEQAECI
jgi:hypothetical protein